MNQTTKPLFSSAILPAPPPQIEKQAAAVASGAEKKIEGMRKQGKGSADFAKILALLQAECDD